MEGNDDGAERSLKEQILELMLQTLQKQDAFNEDSLVCVKKLIAAGSLSKAAAIVDSLLKVRES